eukprot:TRINITY_DN43559_c0_g1_i1.p1 TRINITY_DN43559_c0_g1~~TRINITY_DN43559_c0_g1_i1.p1  ORF type:complete len:160 (-),score=22.94 TRINITY_DN43559_c0_g1_i1:220-651(-)
MISAKRSLLLLLVISCDFSILVSAGLCKYCKYAKFCKDCTLCNKEGCWSLPPKFPNCKMCRYCKYCVLADVCAYCEDGGVLQKIDNGISSISSGWSWLVAGALRATGFTEAAAVVREASQGGINETELREEFKTLKDVTIDEL